MIIQSSIHLDLSFAPDFKTYSTADTLQEDSKIRLILSIKLASNF